MVHKVAVACLAVRPRVVEITDLSSWGVALSPRRSLQVVHREDRAMTAKTKTAKQPPAVNDFAPRVPLDVIESVADLAGKRA
jgi:hypothetical protein